jgi:hypothetical protein
MPAHQRALQIDVTHDVKKDLCGKVHYGRIEIEEWKAHGIPAVVGNELSKELTAFS